jgi:hypothetical protein
MACRPRCARRRPCAPELHRHPGSTPPPGRPASLEHRLAARTAPMPNPVSPAVIPTPSAMPAMWGRVARNAEPRTRCGHQDHVRPGREEPEKNEEIERIHRPARKRGAPNPAPGPCQAIRLSSSSRRVMRKPLSIQSRSRRSSSAPSAGPENSGIRSAALTGNMACAPGLQLRVGGSVDRLSGIAPRRSRMSRASRAPCR